MTALPSASHHNIIRRLFLAEMYRCCGFLMAINLVWVGVAAFHGISLSNETTLLLLVWNAIGLCAVGVYAVRRHAAIVKTIQPIVQLAAIGALTTQVIHDVRGPLASIKVVHRVLQEHAATNSELHNCAEILSLSSAKISTMVEDLLSRYRGESSVHAYIDLHQLLHGLVKEYGLRPDLADLRFQTTLHDTAVCVQGNATLLQRMFGNVLKNAIEAMNFAGTITIRTSCEGAYATIAIQDDGPGMSPETIQKILVGGFSTGKLGGNGIGMTVVREVVQAHGGELRIDSQPGEGSTFHFRVPLAAPAANVVTRTVFKAVAS